MTETEKPDGVVRSLSFHDARPPEAIQADLENGLMTHLVPDATGSRLVYRAKTGVVGAPYVVQLDFEAAFPKRNRYSIRVETSWAGSSPDNLDYYRKSSRGWFDFWTREFQKHSTFTTEAGREDLYSERRDAALAAESQLTAIEPIQRLILDRMATGWRFSTSHKEGGTHIYQRGDRFIAANYGESNEIRDFKTEADFLRFLRQYFDWETSRSVAPNKVPDLLAWRLILRLQYPPRA